MSVSLCMVVYNEGHRIFDSLFSVPDFVDEYVIVDQQSTDNTVDEINRLASQSGKSVKVIEDKHWGYCEPSRNLAHQESSGDWVIVLDADERLSATFIADVDRIMDSYPGCRLQRSFYLSEEHHFTGDTQYRFFPRDNVRYLDELHTEPQAKAGFVYATPYIAIWHYKSWAEQVRDELQYERLLLDNPSERNYDAKMSMNGHLFLLREIGYPIEDALSGKLDSLTPEERKSLGIVFNF